MKRMKLWMMSVVCLPVATALAQTETSSGLLFRAQEASIDLFGTVSLHEDSIDDISWHRIEDDGELGAGIGLNHFITRMFGIGVDAYSEGTHGKFVDNASGNLILRFPIEVAHLAPYIFGGGGYQFDPREDWFGQVGTGLEVRFTPQVGIFADVRYVMPDETDDFGMGRVGIRFAF